MAFGVEVPLRVPFGLRMLGGLAAAVEEAVAEEVWAMSEEEAECLLDG